MKKFIAKVLLLLFVSSTALLAYDTFIVGSQYPHEYTSAIMDKLDRAESIDRPKIILAGHSALSFGICSEMIEEEMEMPVVNLGLHGGLGNAFHERMAKACVKPGDIVVLSHSDFTNNAKVDHALMWTTVDCNYDLLRFCGIEDIGGLLAAYPTYFRNACYRRYYDIGHIIPENSPYSRYAFNAYGDIVFRPQDEQLDPLVYFAETELPPPEIDQACVDRINRLNAYVEKKGATLVITGYPIAYGEFSQFSESAIDDFQSALRDAVTCDVISDYTDYLFPYSLFYNTALHLTQEGAEIRTRQLIADLKQWQASNPAS